MTKNISAADSRKMKSFFERYLTVWVGLCILGGIALGKAAPGFSRALDGMSLSVGGAPVVGVLIEVPVMLMLVWICTGTKHWFSESGPKTR